MVGRRLQTHAAMDDEHSERDVKMARGSAKHGNVSNISGSTLLSANSHEN